MLFCNSAPVKKNIKLSKVLYRGKKSQLHPDLNLLSLFSITLNCWTIVQLFDKYISKSSYSIFKKEKKNSWCMCTIRQGKYSHGTRGFYEWMLHTLAIFLILPWEKVILHVFQFKTHYELNFQTMTFSLDKDNINMNEMFCSLN